ATISSPGNEGRCVRIVMSKSRLAVAPICSRAALWGGTAILTLCLSNLQAQAGCNSGNVGNTDLLSSVNCEADASGLNATAVGPTGGGGTSATGVSSSAYGDSSTASGTHSSAYG